MFEKEAEEYANGKGHEHYNYLFEENAGTPATFANWCFKDGAEFGYSKANEWHYVKDGDLPEDSRTVLDEAGDKFYYFRGHFYYESDTRFDCQPIAWCEIPRYMKEEEND